MLPFYGKGFVMAFKDFMSTQGEGMRAMATSGVIGLHLVSGPLVGFVIGYALDAWLDTSPWCKLIFLFIGICAGFLNVWRDTQQLLRKLEKEKNAKINAQNGEKDK